MKERLDRYLVNNNFTYSRTKAKELIKSGSVKVNDNITTLRLSMAVPLSMYQEQD